jgi:transposase
MNTIELQMPVAGRRRARYSDDFKRQVVAACREPGVSTAAVALANSLNANMLRRWVVESGQHEPSDLLVRSSALPCVQTKAAFVPVKLDPPPALPSAPPADIRIELQHGKTAVQIHWPLQASSQCAQWLREVLA